MPKTMSKDELVMRVKAYGCKMLDRLDLEIMSRDDVVRHLKKSCCKVYERLVKEFGEDFMDGSINERTNP
jgi:dephospho-CoA kinase